MPYFIHKNHIRASNIIYVSAGYSFISLFFNVNILSLSFLFFSIIIFLQIVTAYFISEGSDQGYQRGSLSRMLILTTLSNFSLPFGALWKVVPVILHLIALILMLFIKMPPAKTNDY